MQIGRLALKRFTSRYTAKSEARALMEAAVELHIRPVSDRVCQTVPRLISA